MLRSRGVALQNQHVLGIQSATGGPPQTRELIRARADQVLQPQVQHRTAVGGVGVLTAGPGTARGGEHQPFATHPDPGRQLDPPVFALAHLPSLEDDRGFQMRFPRPAGAQHGAAMDAVVIGGGPAGLMAAEQLLGAGRQVCLYEAGTLCARKLLLATRGGLNLTTADPDPARAYRPGRAHFAAWLRRFGPAELCAWAAALGATPLRGNGDKLLLDEPAGQALCTRWLERLVAVGLDLRLEHRFLGWDDAGALRCANPHGEMTLRPRACVLALGGGSWPGTGSDGAWVSAFVAAGIPVNPLRAANCGVELDLDPALLARLAGTPLRNAALRLGDHTAHGNLVCTRHGLEGTAVYRLVPALRDGLDRGPVDLLLDCQRDLSLDAIARRLDRPRGKRSLATHLKRCLRLDAPIPALLRATAPDAGARDPRDLAALLKALPLPVRTLRPLAEAISSAGGVALEAVDADLRLRPRPGVWLAGEMLDWEAPTGGYLLQGCFTTGWIAGTAAARG